MSSDNSPPPTPSSPINRRSSFASGQRLPDFFGRSAPSTGDGGPNPGPITSAAAQASAQQRRRTSLAGLGLAGSPTSSSPFSQPRNRNSSFGSNSSPNSSIEESAIEDGDAVPPPQPTSPFARRMSFGAKALHDIRTGTGSSNEGYNWSEQIRSRAERSASLTQRQQPSAAGPGQDHHKAASVATSEPPVKEIPRPAKKPDHFQERILKGDFYMD